MASKARDALEFAFEFLAGIEMETDAQNLDRENVLYAIQDALDEPDDPIASAVRAELQPLEDALIDAGHKLAKDGEVEGLMGDVRRAEAEYEAVRRRYDELLYAVARKHPGESRHETALRYIRERESQPAHGPVAAKKEGA